ncbi:unnamed protein product [Leptidea sinapis]|uniref:Uncharacterized protein n=1 Tax=Leptidea sinapis TaxID=189913 RepID=A0A5E4Q371_9NEOP|nr:unnamed protein product [Leptidea sinapis]
MKRLFQLDYLFIHKLHYSKGVVHKRVRSKMDLNLKCRDDPVVLKLDTPEFRNIFTQEVMDLKKIFDKYNFEIRIAGGAVRLNHH